MPRLQKIPFKLIPVLLRYIKDIEYKQKVNLSQLESHQSEFLLIETILEGELNFQTFSKEGEINKFEDFKQYFINAKILEFPSLFEYAEKYNLKTLKTEADVMKSGNIDRYTRVNFIKWFPVKVIDFKKLKEISKKYGKVKKEEMSEVEETTFVKSVLKSGEKRHTFRKKKNGESTVRFIIFKRLWERRCHKKNDVTTKVGEEDNLKNFLMKTKIRKVAIGLDKKIKEHYQDKIRKVITDLQRKEEGFPLSISCEEENILLTVND